MVVEHDLRHAERGQCLLKVFHGFDGSPRSTLGSKGEMSVLAALRNRSNKRRFAKATIEAKRKGHMVCAVVKSNGKPEYFTAPRTFNESEVQDRAFAVREGRPMAPAEKTLLTFAARRNKQEA